MSQSKNREEGVHVYAMLLTPALSEETDRKNYNDIQVHNRLRNYTDNCESSYSEKTNAHIIAGIYLKPEREHQGHPIGLIFLSTFENQFQYILTHWKRKTYQFMCNIHNCAFIVFHTEH